MDYEPTPIALDGLAGTPDLAASPTVPIGLSGPEKAAIVVRLMAGRRWDRALLAELTAVMADTSICGLGQAAGNPITSVLRFFPEDLA